MVCPTFKKKLANIHHFVPNVHYFSGELVSFMHFAYTCILVGEGRDKKKCLCGGGGAKHFSHVIQKYLPKCIIDEGMERIYILSLPPYYILLYRLGHF